MTTNQKISYAYGLSCNDHSFALQMSGGKSVMFGLTFVLTAFTVFFLSGRLSQMLEILKLKTTLKLVASSCLRISWYFF